MKCIQKGEEGAGNVGKVLGSFADHELGECHVPARNRRRNFVENTDIYVDENRALVCMTNLIKKTFR